jgi:hypothetical protein
MPQVLLNFHKIFRLFTLNGIKFFFKEKLDENVDILMTQLDPKNSGKINESQFVKNTKKNHNIDELEELLSFSLIPEDLY